MEVVKNYQLHRPVLSRYQVGDIRPQPDKMYSAEEIIPRVSASGQPLADVRVVIHYPKTAGNISLQAAVNDRAPVTWNQFVYP